MKNELFKMKDFMKVTGISKATILSYKEKGIIDFIKMTSKFGDTNYLTENDIKNILVKYNSEGKKKIDFW